MVLVRMRLSMAHLSRGSGMRVSCLSCLAVAVAFWVTVICAFAMAMSFTVAVGMAMTAFVTVGMAVTLGFAVTMGNAL